MAAGDILKVAESHFPTSAVGQTIREFNKVRETIFVDVENLGAGADITARAFWSPDRACYIKDIRIIWQAATVGVDGSNTLVVDVANATQSGVVIGTVSRTATNTANTSTSLTLTAANCDVAANDVITFAVTQGASADAGIFRIQVTYLANAQLGNGAGTVLS